MMTASVDTIKSAIHQLFDDLEAIALEWDEFTDSDVREAVHKTMTYYFVWGAHRDVLPVSYGMRSKDGDARIQAAVARFLDAASAASSRVTPGQARLDLLQDANVQAAGGMRYDELLGHRDTPLPLEPLPAHMFAEGKYE